MNSRTAMLIRESSEDYVPKNRKRKNKLNLKNCPELDGIGRHIYDDGVCRYCGSDEN